MFLCAIFTFASLKAHLHVSATFKFIYLFTCSSFITLAEILKSHLPLDTPSKWCCITVTFHSKNMWNINYCLGGWKFYFVFIFPTSATLAWRDVVSWSPSPLCFPLKFSLSLQISQRANKPPPRSESEQTELRGERRIRETLSSWVGVCWEIRIVFFFFCSYSWGSISVHFC